MWDAPPPSAAWSQDDLAKALSNSLRSTDQELGQPLTVHDLRREGLYYECQAPGSDTCGLNALNNLCQRKQFKLDDLQQAEAAHAQAQGGGSFAGNAVASSSPLGFFDVEALKLACSRVELEMVEVEPSVHARESRFWSIVASARESQDGSWFLGFLVYDRRPGHVMHYYALRRDERSPSMWLKLDSQLQEEHDLDPRNRRLSEDELWQLYGTYSPYFSDWLVRWYPVVFRAGAAKEVRRIVRERGFNLDEPQALRALRLSGWVVKSACTYLLEELPKLVVRELLVKHTRPSEAQIRSALETARWNVAQAVPAIRQVLDERVAKVQSFGIARETSGEAANAACDALALTNWEPEWAASLMALHLQCGASKEMLTELQSALKLCDGNLDRAEAALSLLPAASSMEEAVTLLKSTRTWSVSAARQVAEVRKKFPRVAVQVASEALRRNDDDPHAAAEMLAEYRKRVQQAAAEAAPELYQGEEVLVAEQALDGTDWDPQSAFAEAQRLASAVCHTRRELARQVATQQFFSAEVILPALVAAQMKPRVAASFLLGAPMPQKNGPEQRKVKKPPPPEEEEEMCSLM